MQRKLIIRKCVTKLDSTECSFVRRKCGDFLEFPLFFRFCFIFCLCVCSDEPDHKKSQTSLNSEEKPLDSETDSLGEYEDPDPSKFNEDGSFIGQYGGRKKSSERIDQDGTTPSALSTFV